MNLIIIKYSLLIGAVLTCTAVVAGPLTPLALFSDPGKGEIAADSVYQFGSDVFYKEIEKPGNEYLQTSVEGYSHTLVSTKEMDERYQEQWDAGVARFHSGYRNCSGAVLDLAGVPEIKGLKEKANVCTKFRSSREEMEQSLAYFENAKASATPGSSWGFSIGMLIPRVRQMIGEAQDAEIACMNAVIADENNDPDGFASGLKDASSRTREIRRIYAELGVISNDFSQV